MALVDELRKRAQDITDRLDTWPDTAMIRHGGDLAALAAHLTVLTELARSAAAARDTLAKRMAPTVQAVRKADRLVAGIGRVDVTASSTTHRYDAPLLIGAAAKAVERDPDSGFPRTVDEAIKAFAVLAGCDAPSFTGWRSGEAEKLGLDLARYRDTTHADRKAVIR